MSTPQEALQMMTSLDVPPLRPSRLRVLMLGMHLLLCLIALPASVHGDQDWTIEWEFTSPTPSEASSFGEVVAIDGHVLAVSEPNPTFDGLVQCGAVYVYDLLLGELKYRLIEERPWTNRRFGRSLAMDGRYLAIGSRASIAVADLNKGHIVQQIPTPPFGDEFGFAVALEGETLVAGIPDDDYYQAKGSALVYELDDLDNYVPLEATPELLPGDYFGTSVDIARSWIAVGAPGSEAFGDHRGSVHVFDRETLQQIFSFEAPVPADNDRYGSLVKLSRDLLAVRSGWGKDPDRVYMYDLATGTLAAEIESLTGADGHFADSMALSGVFLAAGGGRLTPRAYPTGVALFNVRSDRQIGLVAEPPVEPQIAGFGSAVDISRDRIAVGRPGPGVVVPGMVHVFRPIEPTAPEIAISSGACGDIQELTVTNCTEYAPVIVLLGGGKPKWVPTIPNCPSLQFDFGRTQLEAINAIADADGVAKVAFKVRPGKCNSVQIQALDQVTCRLSTIIRP